MAFPASRRPPPLAGLTLAASLTRLCALRGHYREGRHWLDWAATVPMDAPAALRAKALLGSGSLAHLQCDYPAAVHRLEAARASYDQLGDRSGMAAALQALGSVAREQGRYSRAEALHRQALGLAEQDGDQLLIAQSHGYLGFCAWLQANWGGAEEACGQALQLFRALDDGEGIVWSLLSLGVTAQYQGQFASAGQLLGQAHELSVALTYREGTAWTAHELGLLALRRDPATAERWLRAGLAGHRSLGDRWRTASVLVDLAAWTQQAGDDSGAVALLGAAAGIRAAIGTRPAPCERPDQERVESAARARLSAADFARAWAHGQSATVEDLLPPPRPPVRKQARHARSPAGTHADAPHVPEQAGRLRIGALGQASVHCGERMLTPADWGYAKPRELLFYLIASPPRTKDQIGQALWPDLEGPQLRNAFHTALRDLRRALGDPGWVTFTAGRYTMDRSRDHWCDLDIFEEALTAAAHARPAAAALPHLQRAISTYRGDFAADLPDADWLQPRRTELAHAYARALAAAGRLLDGAGRPREAIEVYTRAAEHDPLDELAHRNLIAALIRSGQAGQAARVYHQLTERLRSELGIAPAAQTRELYQRLTQTDARRE